MYLNYFIEIYTEFIFSIIEKKWTKSELKYKVFQTKLLEYKDYSSKEKVLFIEKFNIFIMENYKLDKKEYKQLHSNFFGEYTSKLFESGLSDKQIAIYKLKNPNASNKINLKIPKTSEFTFNVFMNSVKFFYNNSKLMNKSKKIVKKNIVENIKTYVYSLLPMGDIFNLQKNVINHNYSEIESSKETIISETKSVENTKSSDLELMESISKSEDKIYKSITIEHF